MIMKKLIAIAVVFALVAGGAFAADIGATVFAGVSLMNNGDGTKTTTYDGTKDKGHPLEGGGYLTRLRLEGSGENDDGTFGAWIRWEPGNADFGEEEWSSGVQGLAWWKPVDMFKMTIGGNSDGIYGKEGYSGWMFYQMPCDVGINNPGNVWGGGYSYWPAVFRNAFFGGVGSNALMLDIKPVDMIGISIIFPYFNGGQYNTNQTQTANGLKGIFNRTIVQLDVNLDFGNIALTYELMGSGKFDRDRTKVGQKLYLYFNLSAIDNLSLDLGVGYQIPYTYKSDLYSGWAGYKTTYSFPFDVGLAVKFDVNDSFGLKARFLLEMGGNTKTTWTGYTGEAKTLQKTSLDFVADLLPYYGISDNIKIYLGLGIATNTPAKAWNADRGKTGVTWHVNPYVQVGAEWGPTFYAGVRVWSDNNHGVKEVSAHGKEYTPICVDIPIGIQVSF
jgi:hypothetical protein